MISIHHFLPGICTLLMLLAPNANAQIYKWVDAKGQTHYSEKKDEAGQAKTAEVKVQISTTTAPAGSSQIPDWREQEKQFQKRQAQKQPEKTYSSGATSPRAASTGKPDDSDKAKCSLARSIIDGSAKHRNGAPTDKNDMDTARSDTRLFCH